MSKHDVARTGGAVRGREEMRREENCTSLCSVIFYCDADGNRDVDFVRDRDNVGDSRNRGTSRGWCQNREREMDRRDDGIRDS